MLIQTWSNDSIFFGAQRGINTHPCSKFTNYT